MRFPPTNNPVPFSPMDIHVIPVVFAFTFVIEGVGLWYLTKILNWNLRIKLTQSLTLIFFLNLVTFFLGNYILLPLLSPYSGNRNSHRCKRLFPHRVDCWGKFFPWFFVRKKEDGCQKPRSLVTANF